MKYYPIIIFCFNRPNHLKKLLASIYQNKNYNQHKYFPFCDHFKNDKDKANNSKVKNIINNLDKIKNYKLIFRKENFGLSKNIISGINAIFKKNEAAIILEDDLILNRYAINFLNKSLSHYMNDKSIYSISAYSYLKKNKHQLSNKLLKIKRHSSWGWATWKKKWNKVDFHDTEFFNQKDKNFSKLGNDMILMLWAQNNSLIDSWAIRFNFYCYSKNLFSIQPRFSLIKNIGNDYSGSHKSLRINFNNSFKENFDPIYNNKDTKSFLFKTISSNNINRYIQTIHRPSIKLLIKYLLKKLL